MTESINFPIDEALHTPHCLVGKAMGHDPPLTSMDMFVDTTVGAQGLRAFCREREIKVTLSNIRLKAINALQSRLAID